MSRSYFSIAVILVTLGAGHASAQTQAATPAASASGRASTRVLRGTRSGSTIQGNALNSTNGALPNIIVRLRDARLGQIVGSQVTDKSGLFTFKGLDPGTYIVEIVGNDEKTVLAASQMLSINAEEALSAVVRLPLRIPPFAGVLGNSAASVAAVTAAAASASVLAVTTTAESTNAVSQNPPPASR